MTQTANHPFRPFMSETLQAAISFLARLFVGMLFVLIAGIVALMTAIAGLMLAAVALVMRFTGSRKVSPSTPAAPRVAGPSNKLRPF